MRLLAVLIAALIIALVAYYAYAQSSGALVVTTCGTLPLAYSAGATRQITVNTNGQVC